jgi:hypothetical protein
METRVCKKCGIVKELNKDNFRINYIKKNGKPLFQVTCRACNNKRNLIKKKSFVFDYTNVDYNEIRKCTKCGAQHNLKNFTKDKWRKDGFTSHCNVCRQKRSKKYLKDNPDYLKEYYAKNADREKKRKAKWVEQNKDKVIEQSRQWYENNKERKIKTVRKWKDNNIDYFRKIQRDGKRLRMKIDEIYRLSQYIRTRMNFAFKGKKWNKKSSNEDMLGVDYESAKKYIESKFLEGMSWENQGKWHIDHIIPLSSAENEKEMMALAYYKNLQPLWATENLSKSDDYDPKEKEEYLKWYSENVKSIGN